MGPPKNINSRAKTEERSWKEHQKGNILTSHSYPQISKTWSLTQKKKKKQVSYNGFNGRLACCLARGELNCMERNLVADGVTG